jgi:hypothetical protein
MSCAYNVYRLLLLILFVDPVQLTMFEWHGDELVMYWKDIEDVILEG